MNRKLSVLRREKTMLKNILRKNFKIKEIRNNGVIVEHYFSGTIKKVDEDVNLYRELYKDRCFESRNEKNCLVIVAD